MKRIGIVTFNDAHNYGAFLQEYALQEYLKNENYKVEIINYENINFSQLYKYCNNPLKRKGMKNKAKILYNMIFRPKTYYSRIKKAKLFNEVIKKEIQLSPKFSKVNNAIESMYDCFISGSDQVWNVRMTEYDMFYFLDFIKDSKKKISYAASFGRTEFDDGDFELFREYIGKYKSVLIREKSGKEMLIKNCQINSQVVLDPTFLLTNLQWLKFSEKSKIKLPKNKYILLYVVSKPTNMYTAAIHYARQNNYEIILLGRNSGIKINGQYLKAKVDVGPYDFLKYIINSEAVFTTSFHGTILSINLHKPFFYELSKDKFNNNSRLIDITKLFGVSKREILVDTVIDKEINWKNVDDILTNERRKSQELLLKAIEL